MSAPQDAHKHLVDFGGDEFVRKCVKNVEEARSLVKAGFDCVTDLDDGNRSGNGSD
jgi:hypothetical protein